MKTDTGNEPNTSAPQSSSKSSLADHLAKHCAAVYLLSLAGILAGVLFAGWTNTWELLGINAMTPPFADMRHVQGAIQTLSSGIDPRLSNPNDPWLRPVNYPLLWVHLARLLSLDKENLFLLFCTAMIGLYVYTSTALLRRHPSIPLLLLLLSNASLLAIERGNNDLLVFSLIYFATISIDKEARSTALIMIAAGLKIYPICALAANFILKKYRSILAAALIAVIALYFFHSDLGLIQANNPAMTGKGYGFPSLVYILQGHGGAIFIFLVSSAALFFITSSMQPRLPGNDDLNTEKHKLFLVGASLYCGTYLFSSNWDYRMIFLALCIPYAVAAGNRTFNVLILASFVATNAANLSTASFIAYSMIESIAAIGDDSYFLHGAFWTSLDQTLKHVIFLICGGTLARQAVDSIGIGILQSRSAQTNGH